MTGEPTTATGTATGTATTAGTAADPAVATATGTGTAADLDAARQWLDDRAAEHRFSGVAVVWRDGAPVFAHAAGLAHRGLGVPVTLRSRFHVASVTKMITAATALRLVDDGVLDLRRPVVEVLPPEHRTAALTPAHTLHHLLSHTSGLPNYHDGEAETWDSWNSAWDRVPTYHVRRPADLLPLFADEPAQFAPGERWSYADANFVLAGLVIEAATGRPFADVATELVIRPAGMADTAFEDLDTEPVRLAGAYVHDDTVPFERWPSSVYRVPAAGMPDGGVITTPYDLARLLDALPALLSAGSYRLMTTPSFPAEPIYGYGCELTVDDAGEVLIRGHEGCDPGVTAFAFEYLREATTIAVTCNVDRGAWPAGQRLVQAFGLRDGRDDSPAA